MSQHAIGEANCGCGWHPSCVEVVDWRVNLGCCHLCRYEDSGPPCRCECHDLVLDRNPFGVITDRHFNETDDPKEQT